MDPSRITSMIETFLGELEKIYEESIPAGNADLGWERLRRWKRRVCQFLGENVSEEEAQALQDGVDDFTDLGDEINNCKNSLVALLEEIRSHPDMVGNRTPVQTAPAAMQTDPDRKWMELAIREAQNSRDEDGDPHPRVAAVVVHGGQLLATAFRGETGEGHHAEYGALEQKLKEIIVSGATVYTTLEPCTTRRHPKVPCADRLVERKIGRVVIGMVDPDQTITGRGIQRLRDANIPTQLFPPDLMSIVEELNRDFIRACKQSAATSQSGSSPVFPRGERESLESQELDDLQELLSSRFSDARSQGFSQLETLAYSKRVEDCPQLLEVLERTIANDTIEGKLLAIRVCFPILAYTDTETKQTIVQRYIKGFLRLLDVSVPAELRHEAIRIAQLIPDAGIVSHLILILHNEPEEDYQRQSPHPVFGSLKAMEGMQKEILSSLRRQAASTLNSTARQRLLKCMDYIQRG
jgi:pyrimidine deaminase RibD-like protein